MSGHSMVLDGGQWWACQHPERPYDYHAVFEDQCRGCAIALLAAVKTGAVGLDEVMVHVDEDGHCKFLDVRDIFVEYGLEP